MRHDMRHDRKLLEQRNCFGGPLKSRSSRRSGSSSTKSSSVSESEGNVSEEPQKLEQNSRGGMGLNRDS